MSAPASDVKLLTRTEVKKLSYKNIKQYVRDVGLELPNYVTKGNCIKLIFKEKKYVEDIVEKKIEEVCPSSIEYKKGVEEKNQNSPRKKSASNLISSNPFMMTKKLSKNSSSESSEAESDTVQTRPVRNSIVIQDDFLKLGDKKIQRILKSMKRQMNMNELHHFKQIQNCVYQIDHLSAEDLCLCFENNEPQKIGQEALQALYFNVRKINPDRWQNACNVDISAIDLAECEEKFQRFFAFVKIAHVYRKVSCIGRIVEFRDDLHKNHEFTHHVYSALTEIISEPELIRYLMSVLLFCRVGNQQRRIQLMNIGLRWENAKESTTIYLLKGLMKQISRWITASDRVDSRNFDRVKDPSKQKVVLKKGYGALMVEHFSKQNPEEEIEIQNESTNESENGGLPKVAPAMTALMSEMRTTIVELRHVVDEGQAEEERLRDEEAEKKRKETESSKNIRALEFCVPKTGITALKSEFETIIEFLQIRDFEQRHEVLDEFSVSLNRLEETNDEILELWRETEKRYLGKMRAQYLHQIADPHFKAVFDTLFEVYDIELSDALWGEIWAFRQPYEKKVDLRFALEIYDEFVEKYGPLE